MNMNCKCNQRGKNKNKGKMEKLRWLTIFNIHQPTIFQKNITKTDANLHAVIPSETWEEFHSPHSGSWKMDFVYLLLYSYKSVDIISLHYCLILHFFMNQYICAALISSNIITFFLYGIIFLRNTEIESGMYLLSDYLLFSLDLTFISSGTLSYSTAWKVYV